MKEKPKKPGKKKEPEPEKVVELTPRQLKEKRREEARARAAETRKVVTAGTTAWTGKLPAQLLNEYCQRLKWDRVDYPVRGSGESFSASVILSRRNPKTKEVEKVRMDPPAALFPTQKTAIEARHLAATYGLHRIASQKNMQMMLPPFHRDLWDELDKEKAAAGPRQAYKWREDPFQAAEEHKEAQRQQKEDQAKHQERNKERELAKAVRAAQAASPAPESPMETTKEASEGASPQPSTAAKSPTDAIATPRRVRYNHSLTMARDVRSSVEAVLRSHGVRFTGARGIDRQGESYKTIRGALAKLGFEPFQIDEALDYADTLSDALIWLLMHVPEDDIPKIFMPSNMNSTAHVAASLAIENAVARVRAFGYSEEVARSAVKSQGSFHGAMVHLTQSLAPALDDALAEADDIWEEELESIAAIYEGDRFKRIDKDSCKLTTEDGLAITFFKPPSYPAAIPGIGIEYTAKLPKYIILDAIRRTAEQARQELGDYMLLSVTQWLEDNFDSIRKAPAKLAKIASAVSGVAETAPVVGKKKDKARHARPWKPLDSAAVKARHADLFSTPEAKAMLDARAKLPAWQKRAELVKLVADNRVVLVTGETGSGKSTQVVQFVLDDLIARDAGGAANIICTQPRRISAIGVAQRVAEERMSAVGEQVGYAIRGETLVSAQTQLRFVTSGVLLRILQSDPEALAHISHIVVDEVHERSLDGDFLLILLKKVLSKSKTIKIVLMSATVDPALFRNYFKPVAGNVGYTHIEGRTFPVEKLYLDQLLTATKYVPARLADDGVKPDELGRIITSMKDGVDYNLVAATVAHIHKGLGSRDGSILVFMSGAAEIDRTIRAIQATAAASDLWVLPLHASLSPADQRRVFNRAARGQRKVVVSTNVAETSITIADIVAVIDSGRVKEALYDSAANVTKLVDSWTSQASATQRMGRAGRVRAGTCYKLYTAAIESEKMPVRPLPEILRAPLESLYLSVKAMGVGNVEKFLDDAIDPPHTGALSTAKQNLTRYGALDAAGTLTALGQHMALVPADPQTAKLLVLAAAFGCLGTGLTLAAMLGGKPPFVSPKEQREEAKAKHAEFGREYGDLIAGWRAFEAWRAKSDTLGRAQLKQWCADMFVSNQACRDIQSARRQFLGILKQLGFVPTDKDSALPAEYVRYNDSLPIIRAVLGAALTPKLLDIALPEDSYMSTSTGALKVDPEAKSIRYFTPGGERVFMHPGSLMFGANKFAADASYLSYASSIYSSKHFVSGITPLTAYDLLFFAPKIDIDPLGAGVAVDGWTGIKCWPRVGILVQFLKQLFDELLDKKFATPAFDLSQDPVMRIVHDIIATNGRG